MVIEKVRPYIACEFPLYPRSKHRLSKNTLIFPTFAAGQNLHFPIPPTVSYGGPQQQYTNIYYITAIYKLVHKHIHRLCEYIYQYNKIYTSTTICIPVQKC